MASEEIREYWENRLKKKFDIDGTGHISFNYKYNFYVYKAYVRALKKAIKRSGIEIKDKKVLDVGCGTGFWVEFYKNHGAGSVAGIDVTEKSILEMRKRYPFYHFERIDISKERLDRMGKFDIIHAFDVLYYILEEDGFDRAISYISEIAEKNSYIFITGLFLDLFPQTGVLYSKHRCYKRYKDALEMNGIKIIDSIPVTYLLKKPIPFQNLYSNIKWQLSKLHINLEGIIGMLFYLIDGLVMSHKRADTKLIVCIKN